MKVTKVCLRSWKVQVKPFILQKALKSLESMPGL